MQGADLKRLEVVWHLLALHCDVGDAVSEGGPLALVKIHGLSNPELQSVL